MPTPKPVVKSEKKLRAIGITCGIGSMLVGARQAGFEVVGNVEWRRYYFKPDSKGQDTFRGNFPDAVRAYSVDDLSDDQVASMTDCDIALGHPECGRYSNLGSTIKTRLERMKDPCDIPLFLDLVAKFRPRFFVMDDLPKSLGALTIQEYVQKLPGYDLYPEWVANHGYGNIQRGRKRMFMVGSLRSENWVFRPGEVDHDTTVKDILNPKTLKGVANHIRHTRSKNCQRASCLGEPGRQWPWGEVADRFMSLPVGMSWPYLNVDGETKSRVGFLRTHWEKGSHVLTGYNAIVHPLTGLPFSIRERARIQGFPDDFVFYSEALEEDGTWEHFRNIHLVKQTGKAMPIQFCRYVSDQIRRHIQGERFESSGVRLLRSDPNIDSAKRWYCQNIGYSDQEGACRSCWMAADCEIRSEKYGIKEPDGPSQQVRHQSPKTRRSISLKTVVPPPPTAVSLLKGKRPGVGARMQKLMSGGSTDREIVDVIRKEFPGSSATMTDVAKVRARIKGGKR